MGTGVGTDVGVEADTGSLVTTGAAGVFASFFMDSTAHTATTQAMTAINASSTISTLLLFFLLLLGAL